SATSLIDYLLEHSTAFNWQVTVADMDIQLAQSKVPANSNAKAIGFNINDKSQRQSIIQQHDFIVSMLPAFMHGDVARDCVAFGKSMATASYVSDDMKALDEAAKQKGLILINECGLDPGLDHASAMKLIDNIHAKGGIIKTFKSYCGGLVAPQSNDNPWGYKFSWNPRNVVLAGQGTAQYLENGSLKFIPYNRLFSQTNKIKVDGYGSFDAYANRDSIGYRDVYGLKNVSTMLRGTLRQEGYCKAWNVLVKLGLTDDSTKISGADQLSFAEFIQAFLPTSKLSLMEQVKIMMSDEWDAEVERKLNYLEIFSDKKIKLKEGSAAQILQALLEEKWLLKAEDKDMIVMQHQISYLDSSKTERHIQSSLVLEGKNQNHTAMALTVGLPLAITVKNYLSKKFQLTGIQIPTVPSIYLPMLEELEQLGIRFIEQ
ncbi:MAG: saccharopine dehydrogenase C-terminal domain-containing protein, partial [Bacteroidota bacterium]